MNDAHAFDDLIAAAVLEHPAAGRLAFIEEISADDPRLRARLAALLRQRRDPDLTLAPWGATNHPA